MSVTCALLVSEGRYIYSSPIPKFFTTMSSLCTLMIFGNFWCSLLVVVRQPAWSRNFQTNVCFLASENMVLNSPRPIIVGSGRFPWLHMAFLILLMLNPLLVGRKITSLYGFMPHTYTVVVSNCNKRKVQ